MHPHRDASRTKHIEIRRDGPTVTRTRPGYVNPLRMNPPTPPGNPPGSPVDKAMFSVAASDKDSSSQDSTDDSVPHHSMERLNKDISGEMESGLPIREKEDVAPGSSAAEDGEKDKEDAGPGSSASENEKGEDDPANADDGPHDPEPSSPGHVQGMSNMGLDTENAETSSITSHDEHAASDTGDKEPADVPDASTGETSKGDGEKPDPSEPFTDDANLEQTVDEANTEADFSVKDVKKPAKIPESMHLDLGSSSNFHGMDEASKPENDSSEELLPDDALASPEEEALGTKLGLGQRNGSYSSMSKVLKEGASVLLTKVKKDGEDSRDSDDSKESSPTLSDITDDSPLDYRIELARRYTNTCVKVLPPSDTKSARRTNDDREWYSRNLRCISCPGSCPICEIECCIYKAAKEVLAKPKSLQSEMCARLVEVIDGLGARAKDMSTFSMCTLDTGCGRRVCPNCCRACPTEICRDVQCKECKPDPWAECDWHS